MGLTRYVVTDRSSGRIVQTWQGELPADPEELAAFRSALRERGVLRELAEGDPAPDPLLDRWDTHAKAFVPSAPAGPERSSESLRDPTGQRAGGD